MQVGSLVECVKPFDNNKVLLFRLIAYMEGEDNPCIPAVGEIYVVAALKRCTCNRHDVIELQEILEYWWDIRHFRELQPPTPIRIEEILQEPVVHVFNRRRK